MSKHNQTHGAVTETAPEPHVKPVATVAVAESKADAGPVLTPAKNGAKVMLTNGEARVDFIKRRFAEGATRSAITKEVNELSGGATVPYQIIFAATKKPKVEAAAVPAVPATEAAAA